METEKQVSLDQLHKQIGLNVKKYREEKGISQLELSQVIGHKSTTIISQGEIGIKKHFNIKHLHKISIALDIDICKFFETVKSTRT